MNGRLKAAAALPLALGALLAGCNPYEKGLKEDLARSGEQNRTLAKAAMIMNGVKAWSAAHGGRLPSPQEFRREVKPAFQSNNFSITENELQSAFDAFQWTFPGGPPPANADGTPVGRLVQDEAGGVEALANGEVRKGYRSRQ